MLLAAAFLVAATGASPAATAPPEIAHVRTSAFCTAFRNEVLPSVQGVLSNDRLLFGSQQMLGAITADEANGASYQQNPGEGGDTGGTILDEMHLDQILEQLVQNVKQLDTYLAKIDDEIAHASPQERPDIEGMRAQVAAVIEQQKAELYLFSGILATEQLGDLQAHGDSLRQVTMPTPQVARARAMYGLQPTPNPSDLGKATTTAAGVPQSPADEAAVANVSRQTKPGTPSYQGAMESLGPSHAAVMQAERTLAGQITAAANSCGLIAPSPSPSPSS